MEGKDKVLHQTSSKIHSSWFLLLLGYGLVLHWEYFLEYDCADNHPEEKSSFFQITTPYFQSSLKKKHYILHNPSFSNIAKPKTK